MRNPNRKLEKVIQAYIPKNARCRFDEQKREVLREREKIIILEAMEKVSNPCSVELSAEYVPVPPDMTPCRACKEVIYGTGYELVYKLNGEVLPQGRPVRLCEPCYLKSNG